MKKILLCTTALVSIASSALAGDWNVTFSGNTKFEAGVRKFKNNTISPNLTANQKSTAFFSTSRVAVNVTNKVEDTTYGASIRMQVATNQSNGTDRESRMDRSHIFMDSNFGSVQLGTNVAASKLLNVNAGTIASATGGVDGDYTRFLGINENVATYNIAGISLYSSTDVNNYYITNLDTLSNRKDGSIESAEKITYLSPRVEGVQLGVSFTPDLSNGGNSLNQANNPNPTYINPVNTVRLKNIWSLALNYRNSFNDVNVELAATGNFGKSVAPKAQAFSITSTDPVTLTATDRPVNANLRNYTLGAMLEKNGFSAVVSYANDGKSSAPVSSVNGSNLKSSWWTGGVAYANGPMSTSLTYLNGTRGYSNDKLKTQVVSLGGDYEVVAGFKPFAEVTYAQYKPTTGSKLKATVFILGTRVKF